MGRVIRRQDGERADFGSFGARFLLDAGASQGGIALVEHWVPPRTLAAPLHRHGREDEYTLVLQGRMGAQLGEDVVEAGAGEVVLKPRGEWHTFWNPGDEECRLIEIIAPGGFEGLFRAMAADPDAMLGERAAALDARFGLEVDYDSIAPLCARHGLHFPA
ncbi:cupin domain-containing protein [Rubellimicrobium sp. CFH 75288]|uniref:cupin domain-containing protein n=1 Tax=Rubellimicrobium sp. CFH 75288 TaxID=2697034 RepID=UPI0014131B64|nr:cupin domain-containing protein [Rubellimicrobium sp. CFH 75288]NAZ36322.1 cupin domain-containing protein [Rubellimicrobium sp. CFH 75288]